MTNKKPAFKDVPIPPPSMPSLSVSKEDVEINSQFQIVLVCDS
jgi:hypothetical protein